MDGKQMLQKYVVVEGHRDVYEQLYRTSVGEKSPIRDGIAPRLIRDGINLCVYAISGDSYSHSQNTGRYLETALDQIDQFLEEAPRSEGMIQMVKTRSDLPDKVEPGTVKFLALFESYVMGRFLSCKKKRIAFIFVLAEPKERRAIRWARSHWNSTWTLRYQNRDWRSTV